MPLKINPFTGNFDYVNSKSSAAATIPELESDPMSPVVNEAWVLRETTASSLSHTLLHFGMTSPGNQLSWVFKYQTESGQIVGVPLT